MKLKQLKLITAKYTGDMKLKQLKLLQWGLIEIVFPESFSHPENYSYALHP